jgi:hypothetical protein
VAYEVVVVGLARRTIGAAVEDLRGDVRDADEPAVTISFPDQSALVGAINKFHDLGVRIEQVTRTA